jgi:hypothetical protein
MSKETTAYRVRETDSKPSQESGTNWNAETHAGHLQTEVDACGARVGDEAGGGEELGARPGREKLGRV